MRFLRIPVVCCIAFAAPAALEAQIQPQFPVPPPEVVPSTSPAPAPLSPPPPAPPEPSHSLFEPTWREFQFGGRLTNEAGDPARWQRYQDFEEGPVFTGARYSLQGPANA
jgi:hypothetical protein